jgi:hypothetical protein
LGYKIKYEDLPDTGCAVRTFTKDEYDNSWQEISFMVFRTGSVLIVGNCDSYVLNIIYKYLRELLTNEYANIFIKNNNTKKKQSVKKIKKKTILFTVK